MAEKHGTFTGARLKLQNIVACSVEVIPREELSGRYLVHVMADTEEELEDLIVQEGLVCAISTKEKPHQTISGNSRIVVSGDYISGRTFISNGSITINGRTVNNTSSVNCTLVVKIYSPLAQDIEVSDVDFSLSIGDVFSDISLDQTGNADVKIGTMRNLNCNTSGCGNVQIASIQGDAQINTSGTGNVKIKGGRIPTLIAKTSGTGDIRISAQVGDANLTSSGTGDIELPNVSGKIKQRNTGVGEISIG